MRKVYNEVFATCQHIMAKLTAQIFVGNPQLAPVIVRRSLLPSVVLLSAALSVNAQSPTAPAQNFNVFLENAGSFTNNETEGPVAMGGNLNINGSYQVATNHTGNFTVSGAKIGLLVGGRVYYNGGSSFAVNQNTYVKIGNSTGSTVWYKDDNNAYSPMRITPGTAYNGSPRINMSVSANNTTALGSVVSATNNPVFQSGLVDFTAAFNQMRTTSTCMGGLADNANLTNSGGTAIPHSGFPSGYQVKLNLHSGANVLNLNGSDLNNLSDFIYNNTPSASQYLIINVNAPGTFNWSVCNSSGSFGGLTGCSYIIWNFYNTTTLNVQGYGAIEGTIFAPNADIVKTANASNVEGQVIAKSYTHNGGENHYAVFAPTVCATTPPTIALTSQEVMWIDANKCNDQGPRGAWLSFVVTNPNTTAMTGVTVTWSGFTGTNASYFVAPHDLTRTFSSIAPGQSVPVFYYVDYSDVCNHPHGGGDVYAGYTADYTISVASSAGTATRNGTIETKELLTTSAGGQAISSVLSASNVSIGQTFTQTVTYSFGNNTDLFFQPNCEIGFPDGCLRLVKDTVSATSASVTGILGQSNALAFPSASVPSTGNTITIIYTWQVLCLDYPATLHPWAAAKSGTKYKYQDGFDAASTVCFAPTIGYTGGPFCPVGTATVTRTGASGGTYSSTTGLSINASTGAINLAASTPGTYTATYTLAAGCTATTTVTVSSAAAITGTASLCAGNTTTLGHPVSGGTWVSGNTVAATISASGVVSGVANGTSIVTYITPAGCTASTVVTVNAAPTSITGSEQVCVGTVTSLGNAVAGGTWTSGSPAVATVSSSGVVTGVAAGTSNITYALGGCRSTKVVTVSAMPADITGTQSVCVGAVTTFSNTTSGGTWSSGSASIASVGSTGIISGVAEGTAIITYTKLGCYKTRVVTVNVIPTDITGTGSICRYSSTTLSNSLSGGTWSSSPATIATVGSTGIVTGVLAGTANITYTRNCCKAIRTVTVNPLPGNITGTMSVCAGSSTTLGNTTTGGTWSSGNTDVATVNATGVVSGLTAGISIITYATSLGCASNATVTVNAAPSEITGAGSVCVGSMTALSNTVSGGTWSSSLVAKATVDSTGIVTGVAAGTSNITYALAGGCRSIKVISVNALPSEIAGTQMVCVGAVTTFSDATSGGMWSSDNTSIASVGSTGIISGVAEGTTIITYTKLGCSKTRIVTVNAMPAAITGTGSICRYSSTTLSNSLMGGTWSSSPATIATVGSTGIVTGVLAGTANITYTRNCCKAIQTVTVNALPGNITGTMSVCAGFTTALGNTTAGGTWSSGNTDVATVNTSGVVSGLITGTSTITYTAASGCTSSVTVTVNETPSEIEGASSVCIGSMASLSNTVSGGTWSSSLVAKATVDSTGVVTGVAAGTSNITYALGGCRSTKVVTVNALPADITGTQMVCVGAVTTFGDATTGGTWSSDNTSVALVGSTGIISGVAEGTTIITYIKSGCYKTRVVTVNAMPSDITGVASICTGASTTLSNIMSGGTWSSSLVAKATVGSTGIVTGVSAGTANITYTRNCCKAIRTVTVTSLSGDITGTASVCTGSNITLSHTTSGGAWSSNNASVATIDAAGIATGVAPGTAVVTYTLSSGCSKTRIVTVNAIPTDITGVGSVCAGSSTTLGNAMTGGTWSSGSTAIATVAATGTVTGVSAGTANITYTRNCCKAIRTVTVNPLPYAGTISGPSTVCAGTSIHLVNAVTGGNWKSGDTTIATTCACNSGQVTGVAYGTVVMTYTVANMCGTASVSRAVTVNKVPTITPSLISPVPSGASSASMTFATTNAANQYSLVWNDAAHTAGFSDVMSATLPASSMSIAIPTSAVPATYTGTLTVTNGSCASGAQVIGVTVNPSIDIYTFAGNGTLGFTANGSASTATSISHPYHIATDCNGNTYYADYDNAVVRKINAEGVVTTVAGTGVIGFSGNGGPATAARLSHPTGVAVDAAGNLYISDYNNMVVRKVNTAGVITNFAGSAANGYSGDGGPATAAKLSYPSGIAADAAGNIYIADHLNTAIRKVTPSGVISTVAGNGIVGYTGDGGAATAARLANPRGVAVDGSGNIYIADYGNNVIRKVNTSGIISTIAGNTIPGFSGDGGAATAAKLRNPYGIALDSAGNIYFTELQNNIVRKVNTSGVISTIAGNNSPGYSGDKGPAVLAQLNQPMGIAVNCEGRILISDYANYVIRVLGRINRKPFFDSSAQTLQACRNTALSLNSALAVKDFDTLQSMSWTVASAPAHGTLVAGYTTSSTGSLLTPSGLSYTPATGYTGTDVFTVQVSDGIASATTTITVNVSAPAVAGSISGASSMCGLTTAVLNNAAAGGTWSSSNTAVATVNGAGAVTGTGYGVTTISYIVTNGCGTVYTTKSFTVNPLAAAGNVIGAASVCVGSSLVYYDTVLGGTWSVGNTSIATVTPTTPGACIVYGVSAGQTTVTYTVSNSCGISYAFRDVTVQLMPTVAAITGGGGVCNGSALALADSTPNGAWYSSNSSVATVNIVTGLVSGLIPGNTTISYSVHNSCGVVTVTKNINVNSSTFTVSDISGASTVCVAGTTSLTDVTPGGTWSSSNTAKATVGSATGLVTGVATGTTIITYNVGNSCGSSIVTRVMTVNPLPVAGTITGGGSVCVNATRSLSASIAGGVWSSSNTARSTVNVSGVVTGMGAGASTISYGVSNGCGTAYATTDLPVDPLPTAGTVSGSSSVCFNNVTTLASTVAGGSWSSSNTAIASINTSGVVLGNGSGTVTISYTTHNGCGYAYTSRVQTINPLPNVTSISGPSAVNIDASISLSDTAAGGVWSSSNTSLATVGSTGVVNGIAPGTVTISYAVTNSCGTAYATKEINVLVLSAYIVHSNVSTVGGNDGCALLFVSGGTSPYTYEWSNGVVTMNNTWLVAGTYSVLVTDANGDTTSARVTITQPGAGARLSTSGNTNADSTKETLSVAEVLQAQGMVLTAYPNPFQSATTIRFVLPESSSNVALDIYEAATGRKVSTLFSDKVSQGEEYSGYFDAKDLASGIYIYKLSTDNSTFYGKLILNK